MKFLRLFLLLYLSVNSLYAQETSKAPLALPCRDGVYPYNQYYKNAVRAIVRQYPFELLDVRERMFSDTEKEFNYEFKLLERGFLNENNAKVYIKDSKLVGFITYEEWYPRHYALLGLPERKGQIGHLAVDKSYQKNGYAKRLMESVLDDFRKKPISSVKLVEMHTIRTNLDSFYSKFGFEGWPKGKFGGTIFILKLTQNPFLKAMKRLFGYD
jgi:ribosomal protein S18 acetylase RimI-like enzyme